MVLTDDNEQFVDSFLELWRDISDEVSVQDMVSNSKDFGGKLWRINSVLEFSILANNFFSLQRRRKVYMSSSLPEWLLL